MFMSICVLFIFLSTTQLYIIFFIYISIDNFSITNIKTMEKKYNIYSYIDNNKINN
jgi:hypothetical protein